MNLTVTPRYFYGCNVSIFNILTLGIFDIGPMFKITCGQCSTLFKHRIPYINYPTVKCPHCQANNKIPRVV